ncbi:cilia- and flagella-associated protein 58-like [Centruroides sculpturatus]|uniref:cilia- and flagella-associated protein 58-like n=1 Tax=Centruroides sculpturatus TaxID=218467 RepID=UPI000C6CAC4E|nr:cilia- and flagella-associated protein 58-like [Centruroides sculpturatus]
MDKEINNWKEKLSNQSFELKRETEYYNNQKEKISIMKDNLTDILRRNEKMRNKCLNISELRHELISVSTRLSEQQKKAMLLEEHMKNPTNIHKWRILEDNDPENYALIKMNQTLMQQLVSKNNEITNYNVNIKEKNRLFQEMKTFALRQFDLTELKQKLEENQILLKQKSDEIKSLSVERDHLYIKYEKEKQENDELRNQLKKLKVKIWLKKKSSHFNTEQEDSNYSCMPCNSVLQLPPIIETDETSY